MFASNTLWEGATNRNLLQLPPILVSVKVRINNFRDYFCLVDLSHNIVSHAHSIADHQATLTQAQKILRNVLKRYILLGIEKLSFMYRTPTELDKCITPTISVMTSVAVGLITIVEITHTLQTGCPCIAMDGYRSCTVNERLVSPF